MHLRNQNDREKVSLMNVLLIGAGYVGLVTGVVLSNTHKVTLLDVDESKIKMINQGDSPLFEPNLPQLLRLAISEGRLHACLPSEELSMQDMIFICVGTPSSSNGAVDLSSVEQATSMIFDKIDEICGDYCVLGMKSTVPPGTTRRLLLKRVHNNNQSDRIGIVSNPEFLSEGSAVENAQHPDRIIIGTNDNFAAKQTKKMHEECLGVDETVYHHTTLESAELCKYVSNCFLATKISFANEIANLAEHIPGVNFEDVMRGVGMDHRIAPSFFEPGAGFGGSCLPKDLNGLIHYAQNWLTESTPLMRTVWQVNSQRPKRLVDMLLECIGDIRSKKIAILGLAFKPGTDDTRESPSLKIIHHLNELEAEIWVHDPVVRKEDIPKSLLSKINFTMSLEDCMNNSDGCILVTKWEQYLDIGLRGIVKNMRNKTFIDGRRMFSKEEIPDGVTYRSIGMPIL